MIELKVAERETAFQDRIPGIPKHAPDTVYSELPPGLIDLPSAGRKYNVPRRTIHSWVNKGRVRLRGRLRGPTRGGGYLVVSEADLVAYLEGPRNKGGAAYS